MILNRRSHHAGCPPMSHSEVIAEQQQSEDLSPRSRDGKASASKRMSRIMSMALPSRIVARLFPESNARKSVRTPAPKISDPILINSTNIATPTPTPRERPASMFDTRAQRFSHYSDYNTARQRTSAVPSGGASTDEGSNFF